MENEKDPLTLAQLFERLADDVQQLFKVRINLGWMELRERLFQVLKQFAVAFLILIFVPMGFFFLNVGLILFLYYEWHWRLPPLVLTFGGINFLLGGGIALAAFFWLKSRAPLPEQKPEEVAPGGPAVGGEEREQSQQELEKAEEEEEEEISQTLSGMRGWVEDVVSWKKWVEGYPIESVSGALALGLFLGYRYRPPLLSFILSPIHGLVMGALRSSVRSFLVNGAIKQMKKHFLEERNSLEERKGERVAQISRSAAEWAPNGRFKEEGVSCERTPK